MERLFAAQHQNRSCFIRVCTMNKYCLLYIMAQTALYVCNQLDLIIAVQPISQDNTCSHIKRLEHQAGFEQVTHVTMRPKPNQQPDYRDE
jgi:hypothetical protein